MMNKRIPTLLGLLILVAGIAGGVFLVNQVNLINTKASSQYAPQNIRLSNITHNSFTVSWSTNESATGMIRWGKDKNNLNNVAINDQEKKHTHYIEINNLSPSTDYHYRVYSNSKNFNPNEEAKSVRTGAEIAPKPVTEIASGKIITKTGLEVENALVYAEISGGNLLSDMTTKTGGWVIPTSKMRSKDLSNYLKIDGEDNLNIFVDAGPLGTAQAKIKANTANPVPPIVLGQDSDFSNEAIQFNDEVPEARLNFGKDVKSSVDFLFN